MDEGRAAGDGGVDDVRVDTFEDDVGDLKGGGEAGRTEGCFFVTGRFKLRNEKSLPHECRSQYLVRG